MTGQSDNMDIIESGTNRGNKSIIFYSHTYRLSNALKMETNHIDAPKMYSIHGCKNGNYVPLLYALLPSKTQECYEKILNFVLQLREQQTLTLKPLSVHIDFELSKHNAIMHVLPGSKIESCRFHLGQNWWRKIQNL